MVEELYVPREYGWWVVIMVGNVVNGSKKRDIVSKQDNRGY